jgi:cell division protein FtsX
MPPGFALPKLPDDQLWPVLQLGRPDCRCPFWLTTVARLAPGVTPEQARGEFPALAAALLAEYPGADREWAYEAEDLKTRVVGDARATVLVLYGAVALVLLLTAANVANLFLARAAGRGPELAVRAALGAGRPRLARQLVTESLAVAALGGAVGVGLATLATRVLRAVAPGDLPRLAEVRLDGTVLLVALGTVLVTGVLTGLAPALQVPHGALTVRLREGGPGRRRRGAPHARGARGGRVRGRARGARGRGAHGAEPAPAAAGGRGRLRASTAAGVAVAASRRPRRATRPSARGGVLRRGAASGRGGAGRARGRRERGRAPERRRHQRPPGGRGAADPGGSQRRSPRCSSSARTTSGRSGCPSGAGALHRRRPRRAPLVAVINETLARQFFPGRDPLGRWVRTGGDGNPKVQVVGVVPDVRHQGLDAAPVPTVYTPHHQNGWWRPMHLVVRTDGGMADGAAADPLAVAPALRRAVATVDAGVPLDDVRSLEQLVYASAARPRFRATLLGAFGGLALAIAGAGIYGLMAYTVRQRRREMGVRLALGAPRGAVVRLVVGDGMRLAGAGVALGLIVALALARLLASVLFEVSPADPLTFGATTLVLAAMGLAACAVPAWRASRTDAMVALRAE